MNHDVIRDPAIPIIDSHHHLWTVPLALGGRAERRYLADDLASDLACGHNIIATVYVECGSHYRSDGPDALRPLGETEFVMEQVSRIPQFPGACAGIVGFADLCRAEQVGELLDAHAEVAKGRFRGIRQMAAFDDDPVFAQLQHRPAKNLLRDSAFRAGFAVLASRGLSFDAMVFHPQLEDVPDLAQAFPETTIILNHLGGLIGIGNYANHRQEALNVLKSGLLKLSECRNVLIKLGGLGMFLRGSPLLMRDPGATAEEIAAEWGPLVHFAIDTFGPTRCLFESNFPVDSSTCSYQRLWNVFKILSQRYSETERRYLFAETAARAYGLERFV